MSPETAKALSELGRAAARHVGIPDDVPIIIEILPDRDYSWCSVEDNYVEVSEQNIETTNNRAANDHSPAASGSSTDVLTSAEEDILV
jgi:hypothetical protein